MKGSNPLQRIELWNGFLGIGLVLLAYTFWMTFTVPLGPGIEKGEMVGIPRLDTANHELTYKVDIQTLYTHFESSSTNAFIRRGENRIAANPVDILNDEHLQFEVTLPQRVSGQNWIVVLNDSLDGTMDIDMDFADPRLILDPNQDARQDGLKLHKAPEKGFQFPFLPRLYESIRNLMLHVPMWFTMFLLMGISFVASILAVGPNASKDWDLRAVASVKVGIWFGMLGLLTGSLWARFTWGAWWVSDPQLNGAFVTVLAYAGYLILRKSVEDDELRARLSGVYNLFAFCLLVVLLMVMPRYTDSLHPGKGGNPGFNSYDLDNALRLVFYPAVVGWMLLGTWMYSLSLKKERLVAQSRQDQFKSAASWTMIAAVPAGTSSFERLFTSNGLMPVVIGVALIIVFGLLIWYISMSRSIRRLEKNSTVKPQSNPLA